MGGVPVALAAVVASAMAAGCAWALLVPPGQGPDEPVHVAYVQSLAERGQRPDVKRGKEDRDTYSSEEKLARNLAAWEPATLQPSVRAQWDRAAYDRWLEQEREAEPPARGDGGGRNPAAGNPPLYYAWEAVPYRAAIGSGLFARWTLMRLWSVLLLAVAAVATWALAGELTGGDRLAQMAAAACVGLQPLATSTSAVVNPDGAVMATWALAFWLGARVLRRGPTPWSVGGLLAAALAALLVKASSFGLLPAVGLVLAIAARRTLRTRRIGLLHLVPLVVIAAGGLAAALLAGAGERLSRAFEGGGHASLRGFGSYLWQAYLPNLPFQTPVRNLAAFWGYDVWIKSGWGSFGWAELLLPAAAYAILAIISVGFAVGALVALTRRRFRVDRPTLAFLGAAALALVLGLHWSEYRQFIDIHLSLMQGRYLLPLLPLGGLAVAATLANLPSRHRPVGLAVVLSGLFALQLFSLGVLIGRFYA